MSLVSPKANILCASGTTALFPIQEEPPYHRPRPPHHQPHCLRRVFLFLFLTLAASSVFAPGFLFVLALPPSRLLPEAGTRANAQCSSVMAARLPQASTFFSQQDCPRPPQTQTLLPTTGQGWGARHPLKKEQAGKQEKNRTGRGSAGRGEGRRRNRVTTKYNYPRSETVARSRPFHSIYLSLFNPMKKQFIP